jgi:acyl-CoA synthetase (AMP-forming)/AMP-acid ligase II
MICSNQQMILQTLPFLGDAPPVLVDWLPWHHTFGGNHNIGIVIYNGGSLHIDDGRPLPGAFDESVRCLREVLPTVYLNVPKGYEELIRALGADRALAERFFSTVQVLFYAAASLSQHVSDELERLALETCGERLVLITGLGATETAPMAICRPWASQVPSAIGLPVPGVEAKLAPVAQKLEMRVRGPNVTPGYWQNTEATEAAFEDGWYRTGDVGYLDDERYLWLLDRAKDMIVTGGENVYSIEVEDVLARHPSVLECAVFGVPDERWVEAVHAIVVVSPDDAARQGLVDDLVQHCRASIAGFKVPKQIEVRTKPLPKSGPGKVQKRELRAPYWAAG